MNLPPPPGLLYTRTRKGRENFVQAGGLAMDTATDTLHRIGELLEAGQYLSAYAAAEPLGPLRTWTETDARIVAGRLAWRLGAPKLGRVMHELAWRASPRHPRTCFYHATSIFHRRGPLATWEFMEQVGQPEDDTADYQAYWQALRGRVLATLRDFTRAHECLDRAQSLAPDDPYVWINLAGALGQEDRVEEALDAACHARRIDRGCAPAVEISVDLLLEQNRDEEARALLLEADKRFESGLLLWRLGDLELGSNRHAAAREIFDRVDRYLPLMEKDITRQLAARRADAAYFCGDHADAAAWARQVKSPYYDAIADRLDDVALSGCQVTLPVEFVRQHYRTCAPATLSALAGYWSKPADHLSIAQEICYGGTPNFRERCWAEDHGFATREFRVTWESAVALIDRGVPFVLQTAGPGWAHAQAVVGYDSRLGMLWIRNPSERYPARYWVEGLLERHRFHGPRGLALVPREQSHRLEGVELPDADLYDRSHRAKLALDRHDRAAARAILDEMRAAWPDHALTLDLRASIADYDGDTPGVLAVADQMLARYPDEVDPLLSKLSCLRHIGRRSDRLTLLEEACRGNLSNPLLWTRYADELTDDARQHGEAEYWLRRAIRAAPQDAKGYNLLASVRWSAGSRRTALELYRFAACLEDTDEQHVRSYFIASRYMKQTDAALALLRENFDRYGRQSNLPGRMLSWAYSELERTPLAIEILDEAMTRRPDDGDLRVYAAGLHGQLGRHGRADALMREAEGRCHPGRWLRTAIDLAMFRGDVPKALELSRDAVAAEPLAYDAHGRLARLLAGAEGYEAAVAHLRQAVANYPHHYALRTLLIEWLRDDDPAAWESAVREMVEIHPVDPWARRELALALVEQHKLGEALVEAHLGLTLDPSSPVAQVILGHIARDQGELQAARDAYREAVRLSVDHDPAVVSLVRACQTRDEQQQELEFIYQELVAQTILGDGLLTYRNLAADVLEPESLLRVLREAHSVRPDLWHSWSALVQQFTAMDRAAEAVEYAQQAAERFPLLPRVWVDLALAYRASRDEPAEIAALEQSLEINPGWSTAAGTLAEAHHRTGNHEAARTVLERAVRHNPLDAVGFGFLADACWLVGRPDEAINHIQRALRLDPGYQWAWDMLRQWTAQRECPTVARDFARELAQRRPFDSRVWLALGETLTESEDRAERRAAFEQALSINPREVRAHQLLALDLANEGQFDEALALCRAEVFGDRPPWELRIAAADIEARRGRRNEAIRLVGEVVAERPDIYDAWRRLADWYDADGQTKEYLDAAEHLTRIAPANAMSWGYLGDARRKCNDAQGAVAAFERAMDLAADYWYAAMSLCDLHLDAQNVDCAARVLDRGRDHIPRHYRLGLEVRLACARNDRAGARQSLVELCRGEIPDRSALNGAILAIGPDAAASALQEAMVDERAHPATGAALVNLAADRHQWRRCRRLLRSMRSRGEMWILANESYLVALGENKASATLALHLFWNGKRLRADSRTWHAAGYALLKVDRYQMLVRWLSDWQSRTDVTPAVLAYLAIGLWELDRLDEAERVSRHARQLPPDHMTPYHDLWLAAHEMLDDRAEAAAARLECLDPAVFSGFYASLYRIVRTTVDLLRSPGGSFFQTRRQLLEQLTPFRADVRQQRVLWRLYYRALHRFAIQRGHRLIALWATVRSFWPRFI